MGSSVQIIVQRVECYLFFPKIKRSEIPACCEFSQNKNKMSASPEQNNSVQGILHDSLTSVGFEHVTLPISDKNIIGSNLSKMDQNGSNIPSMSLLRREGSNMSVASLPATMKDGTQKPFFRSKIPTPTKSGRTTPTSGMRTRIPQLRASTEKLNNSSPTNNTVKGQIRKWESSASLTTGLELHNQAETEKHIKPM